jgi:hypothetical protein
MTYNQIISTLQSLLSSHALIKTVKNSPPKEWLLKDAQVVYPVSCFNVLSGTFNKGREQIYTVQFYFLDKSGAEGEFQEECISDQCSTAHDIVELIRGTKRTYTIDDSIIFNTIADKYEDYLAGVEMTINFTTQSSFDGCDVPTI